MRRIVAGLVTLLGVAGISGVAEAQTLRMMKALDAPDVRGKLEDNGMAVIGGSPEEFAALIEDGIARYGAIIKATGIQAE